MDIFLTRAQITPSVKIIERWWQTQRQNPKKQDRRETTDAHRKLGAVELLSPNPTHRTDCIYPQRGIRDLKKRRPRTALRHTADTHAIAKFPAPNHRPSFGRAFCEIYCISGNSGGRDAFRRYIRPYAVYAKRLGHFPSAQGFAFR